MVSTLTVYRWCRHCNESMRDYHGSGCRCCAGRLKRVEFPWREGEPLFYNQPLAIRFGTELLRHVDQLDDLEPFWDTLDIAVAWVRASGIAYLSDRLWNFSRTWGQQPVCVVLC